MGNHLNCQLGLDNKVSLEHGSVLELQDTYGSEPSYDHAFMLHVGMNIENKDLLISEVGKLQDGGKFAIYDVMRIGSNSNEDLDFPVPWATDSNTNACDSIDVYMNALEKLGLKLLLIIIVMILQSNFLTICNKFKKSKLRKTMVSLLHLVCI